MKKVLASLLLITSVMCCNNFDSNNQEKANKKHRYGEKILVLVNH